jgi:hypothetical protein
MSHVDSSRSISSLYISGAFIAHDGTSVETLVEFKSQDSLCLLHSP